MAETTKTPISVCKCGVKLDCATGDREPRPGDYSLCVECFEILRFDENMWLRSATPDEIAEMPAEMKAQLAMVAAELSIIKNTRVGIVDVAIERY
jgi:hypothetical protein